MKGNLSTGRYIKWTATDDWIYTSPAIGDINNDGKIEIVVGSGDGYVYTLRGTDGALLWSYYIGTYYWEEDVVLADVDPSPGMEVITHGRYTPTYVLSSSGILLWQMSPVDSQLSLSVGDVGGDGCVEIVAVGEGIPMVGVIDASSNEGGCGFLGFNEELSVNRTNVKVYSLDGRMVFIGKKVKKILRLIIP